jgi:hypothetical protein
MAHQIDVLGVPQLADTGRFEADHGAGHGRGQRIQRSHSVANLTAAGLEHVVGPELIPMTASISCL